MCAVQRLHLINYATGTIFMLMFSQTANVVDVNDNHHAMVHPRLGVIVIVYFHEALACPTVPECIHWRPINSLLTL